MPGASYVPLLRGLNYLPVIWPASEVGPVSAPFVTELSTVVPRCLFLMLIYSLSILDGEPWSGTVALSGVQETIEKTAAERSRQLAGLVYTLRARGYLYSTVRGGRMDLRGDD